ncbi:hypothetical protein [Clostridium fungisolvens]|uniref:SdpI family protein n=1 Tax=Clostridium fungisolvens TaxID=1604897 RepID=A0A6V8SBV8_9CLOT|nr:hypothetical protein [Clostridium fungisolvens]GFP74724.1 hypothetical protein bsdtw1_00779 [Clostridium fungisolvens]
MNKDVIFNMIVLSILIIGILSIVVATIKPMKLINLDKIKPNGKAYIIKDKQGFIKYNQKVFWGFGIMCSVISILSLAKIIDYSTFCIGVGFIISIVALLNSISIKKYA